MTELTFTDSGLSDTTPCRCADCDWRGQSSATLPIADAQERLTPGDTIPAGQCPDCGALAYLEVADEGPNNARLARGELKPAPKIVRQFSAAGPCLTLGRLTKETPRFYFFNPWRGGDSYSEEVRRVGKKGRPRHIEPCSSCTDHPKTQYPNGYMD